jgi:hypothetical protein
MYLFNLTTSSLSDDFLRSQPLNLILTIPQHLSQNLIRMLSQQRRRCPNLRLNPTILDWMIHQLHLAHRQMLYLLNHVPGKYMFMLHRALDIVDRCIRHAAALKDFEPFLGGFGHEFGFDERVDDVTVFDAERVGDEALIGFPFRFTKLVAKDAV